MYQLRVLAHGNPVQVYHDYRTGQDWIEGRNGIPYTVEVKNNSYNRILAVVSVDGLNVINGKHESYETAPGYILHSYNNIKIPGWKISAKEVKEFYFTHKQSESYSHKIGANESNIGVIAAAIFTEKPVITWTTYSGNTVPWHFDYPTTITCGDNTIRDGDVRVYNSNVSCMSNSADMSMETPASLSCTTKRERYIPSGAMCKAATGSGEKKDFVTHKASFGDRVLQTVITLYYDTYEGLLQRGIITQGQQSPRPFPDNEGYCPNV
jgi:hypothetical protein